MTKWESSDIAVFAEDLSVKSRRGAVFGPLNFILERGSLTAVAGPQGSGRSSALLTISGRMKPSSGDIIVYGQRSPRYLRRIQHISAIACFSDIDDLDAAMRVSEMLYERLSLITPWYKRIDSWDSPRISAWRRIAFGGAEIHPDAVVWDLPALQQFQLRVLLALVDEPRLLCVDDVDQLSNPDDQRIIWDNLRSIARTGMTVVAATSNTETLPEDIPRIILVPNYQISLGNNSFQHDFLDEDMQQQFSKISEEDLP